MTTPSPQFEQATSVAFVMHITAWHFAADAGLLLCLDHEVWAIGAALFAFVLFGAERAYMTLVIADEAERRVGEAKRNQQAARRPEETT